MNLKIDLKHLVNRFNTSSEQTIIWLEYTVYLNLRKNLAWHCGTNTYMRVCSVLSDSLQPQRL